MAFDPLTAVLDIGNKVIDRLWPDPTQAAQAKLELMKLQESGELQRMTMDNDLLKGQLDIDKIEAANPNLFVSGWRPGLGWTCVISIFCYYVPYTVIATGLWAWQCIQTHQLVTRPDLGIADLLGLVATLLGMAGMRTYEKKNGVAAK